MFEALTRASKPDPPHHRFSLLRRTSQVPPRTNRLECRISHHSPGSGCPWNSQPYTASRSSLGPQSSRIRSLAINNDEGWATVDSSFEDIGLRGLSGTEDFSSLGPGFVR